MEELTQSLQSLLEGVGFTVDRWYGGITVNGCRYRMYRNHRNAVFLEGQRFPQRRVAGYDIAGAFQRIVSLMPAKLQELERQKTADWYREQAKQIQENAKELPEDRECKVYGDDRGIHLTFTFQDATAAAVLIDMLRDYAT